jgi:hypothetical protein
MKKWAYLTLFFIFTLNLWASNPQKNILDKVSFHVEELNHQKNPNKNDSSKFIQQLNVQKKNEIAFWNSLIAAYDLLKSMQITERYNFQYEAAKAYAVEGSNRVAALNKWLEHENQRIYQIGLHPSFYKNWKKAHARIKVAIQELRQVNINATSFQTNLLNEAKREIALLQSSLNDRPAVNNKNLFIKEIEVKDNGFTTSAEGFFLLVGACYVTFLLGQFLPRRKKSQKVRSVTKIVEKTVPVFLPALPAEAYENENVTATAEKLTNLEEQCLKVMAEKNYLLDAAQIKLHPTTRSPFKTDVNVNEEVVKEAINWLLQGTIAISKTAGTKQSHLDWSCHEKAGRISLDFTLHGIECDSESLYLNALVEGDASAPAHFGRTEQALTGHTATVSLRCANKKTVISLGLDSISGQMSH